MGKKVIKFGIDDRFDRLTLIGFTTDNDGRAKWVCRCDCGNIVEVRPVDVRRGYTKSCGCLRKETVVSKNYRHGDAYSRLYEIWCGIAKRCNDCNSKSYPNYGGRGIKRCDEWNDYNNFRQWAVNNGYSNNLTLDRINVNGDYSPDNCRWVDVRTQCRNKRNNHNVTYNGVTRSVAEWAELIGCGYNTLHARLHRLGWSIEKALSTPIER